MKKLLPVILFLTLTGCEIVGPSVKIEAPKIIVDEAAHGKGIHCPPGQAKKGKC